MTSHAEYEATKQRKRPVRRLQRAIANIEAGLAGRDEPSTDDWRTAMRLTRHVLSRSVA
jgi:hypothetical protein